MEYIIDRFEGEFAVVENENGEMINIEKNKIEDIAEEGDVILFDEDHYIVDYEKTEQLKKEVEALINKSILDD